VWFPTRGEAGGFGAPLNHPIGVRLGQGIAGELAGRAAVFRIADAGDAINAPFFDIEDDYHVKADLWLTGSVALTLMDLLYGVNLDHKVIGFRNDFPLQMQRLAKENDGLVEMNATDRFKCAMPG